MHRAKHQMQAHWIFMLRSQHDTIREVIPTVKLGSMHDVIGIAGSCQPTYIDAVVNIDVISVIDQRHKIDRFARQFFAGRRKLIAFPVQHWNIASSLNTTILCQDHICQSKIYLRKRYSENSVPENRQTREHKRNDKTNNKPTSNTHVLTRIVIFNFSDAVVILRGSRRTTNDTFCLAVIGLPMAHMTVPFSPRPHEYCLPCTSNNLRTCNVFDTITGVYGKIAEKI